jgi:hypothetical protein
MDLGPALDRFWAAAAARRLGIDGVHVAAADGRRGERRRIDDIRRDVFSVSKTVTSLAIGMPEGDGALSWLCARDGACRMDGIYGQLGIVLPGPRACVSVTAHYRGPTTRILDCVWEHIVPALA